MNWLNQIQMFIDEIFDPYFWLILFEDCNKKILLFGVGVVFIGLFIASLFVEVSPRYFTPNIVIMMIGMFIYLSGDNIKDDKKIKRK